MQTTRSVFKILTVQSLFVFFSMAASAQNALDQYVTEGLNKNLVIQQQKIDLRQAENALRIARNHFLPTVQILADYTSGEGGRNISLPVGDLLNPVYASLNQLTQSDEFPQIENVNQNFFPRDFYDARVRTSIPLVNTDLVMNRSIKTKQLAIKDYEVKAYKRQLAFEIQLAYFQYLSAVEAVKIYEGALELVNRNVFINESLKKHGKGLAASVLRSKSEAAKVKAELNTATNKLDNSRKYFNFLLNRDLDLPVDAEYSFHEHALADTLSTDIKQREEIAIQKIGMEISGSALQMERLNRLPKLSAFLDLGSQSSGWRFNDKSTYYLVGVQLSLPVFQGFTNNIKISQSKLDLQKSSLALKNSSAAIQLSAEVARKDLMTARQNYLAANDQLKASESYFSLIEKGYQQGVNSLIEFLDARNQLTTSAIVNNLRAFDMLIAKAKLERETASFQINN